MPAEAVGGATEAAPVARPEAALAAAVLHLAVADAQRDGLPGLRARAWLRGSPWAAFWCRVAGVDVEAFRGRVGSLQTVSSDGPVLSLNSSAS